MLTYRLDIDSNTFTADKIMSINVQKALCEYGKLTVGNVCSKTLNVTIVPGNITIAKRATVKLYSAPAGTTTWTPRGTFYIDTRRRGINTLSLVCYDGVLMMNKPFILDNVPDTWPYGMKDALDLICARLGITADASIATYIQNTGDYRVPYTNELTMREVASRIASAHAGNLIINDANALQFIPINAAGLTATNLIANGLTQTVTGYLNIMNTWGKVNLIQGHKYYITAKRTLVSGTVTTATGTIMSSLGVRILNDKLTVANSPLVSSEIFEWTNTTLNDYLALYGCNPSGTVVCENTLIIDLTATFGAGNEPDLATCQTLYPDYFDGTISAFSLYAHKNYRKLTDAFTFNKVTIFYDDESYYSAGSGDSEFIFNNEYATQAITDAVLTSISGYVHNAYEITGAIFASDAIPELGQSFVYTDGTVCKFFEGRINYNHVASFDMTSPYDQEVVHEYPSTGQYLKEIRRKVSLGTNYYGTTIDRDNGLTIEKEDGLSKVIMNSESMKWQVDKGAGLADRLYFDAVAGDLKYNGSLEIQQDDNKAKTVINASETAIYGATGSGGALEKNFYVDSTGKIKVKNIELAGSMNLSSGSITWGGNNPVPSYIGATNIDMSSVSSPYVIAGSLQGSNFVHYPPSSESTLLYSGSAMQWDTYWGSNIFLKGSGTLTGLAVGSVVNVGSSQYGMNYVYQATIANFRLGDGTIVTYPTQICNLNIPYVNMTQNVMSAYISLASQTTLGDPFTLYNVPITNHTDLSSYAGNKLGGIKYSMGKFNIYTENDTAMKIHSDGALEIESDSIFMKQISNGGIIFYWGNQVYVMNQAANVGSPSYFIRLV